MARGGVAVGAVDLHDQREAIRLYQRAWLKARPLLDIDPRVHGIVRAIGRTTAFLILSALRGGVPPVVVVEEARIGHEEANGGADLGFSRAVLVYQKKSTNKNVLVNIFAHRKFF